MNLGYTGRTFNVRGYTIREWVTRIAYARNGNAHNPTVYKSWHVYLPTGKLIARCATFKEAKEVAK